MITFIYSTVNAGKSANLLMRAHSCETSNIPYQMFIPEICAKRDGQSQITSRTGFTAEAQSIKPTDRLYPLQDHTTRVVFVDEAQFLTKEQVFDLCKISSTGVMIYAFGLRTDFQGEPFEGSKYLLAWAENIEEITTFSRGVSGDTDKAIFNVKLDSQGRWTRSGESKDVGFHYLPVSLREFFTLMKNTQDLRED